MFEVARQHERLGRIAVIEGSVRAEGGSDVPLIVVLARQEGGDAEAPTSWRLVDYVVRERPGPFWFRVREGRYRVGAYQDLDGDLRFDAGEPAVRLLDQPVLEVASGETSMSRELVIRAGPGPGPAVATPFDVAEAVDQGAARANVATLRALVVRGEVSALDAPRFAPELGARGLWAPADFLQGARPGVYFLEPYRGDRIPVLFIHGIGSTPAVFAPLVAALDRERFQPWVFFYPSGLPLRDLGKALASLIAELQLREGFTRLAVVGYSMGGLVARSFVLEWEGLSDRPLVPLFVSIATPFGGEPRAAGAAEGGSGLPPGTALPLCFQDLAPSSAFLRELFFVSDGVARPLPAGTRHHLIFAFRRKPGRTGASGDGIVELSSQLRPEAQQQAASLFGVDANHVGVLSDPATAARVNALLAAAFEAP